MINGQLVSLDRSTLAVALWLSTERGSWNIFPTVPERAAEWRKKNRKNFVTRSEKRDVKFISIRRRKIPSATWVSINYMNFFYFLSCRAFYFSASHPSLSLGNPPSTTLERSDVPFIIFKKTCDFQLSGPSHFSLFFLLLQHCPSPSTLNIFSLKAFVNELREGAIGIKEQKGSSRREKWFGRRNKK